MKRVVLVAGASSGLGRATAAQLAADGFTVYAGARSFGQGKPAPEGCSPLTLDVTDPESVRAAVSAVVEKEGCLYALVNCAAFLTLGSAEETSPEELAAVLRTNFIGSVRMIQAALPVFRRQKEGRIVQFTSLNGLFGIPFQSAYTASKHALEGWCQCLAQETARFGVRVTLVSPGDCRSGSDAYRGHAQASAAESSPYRPWYLAATAKIHADESGGLDPRRVGRAVSRALQKKRTPARLIVAGLGQRPAVWLDRFLPLGLFNSLLARYYAPRKHASQEASPTDRV